MFSRPATSVKVLPYSCVTEVTCPASKPRARASEVGRAHRHLGQAAQEGQRVVEAQVQLQARVHGHAERRRGPRSRPGRRSPLPVRPR